MDNGYKGNALEKIEDAEKITKRLKEMLTTGQITTDELLYWLAKLEHDLAHAMHFAKLI